MQAGVETFREAFLEALLTGEERAAEITVREAMEAGYEEETISEQIVAPALFTVGDMWGKGLLSVADEHMATQISLRVLALQRSAFERARERQGREVVLAGVEGEQHVVGLEMAENLLSHSGFDVRNLGANVPLQALTGYIARRRPHVVGLTVTMPDSAALLDLTIDEISRAAPGVCVLVGGSGIPRGMQESERVARASLVEAVEKVDWLLVKPWLN